GVFAIEVGRWLVCDEELTAVRIDPGIRHAENASAVVRDRQRAFLVIPLIARPAASAALWIASLYHKVLNNGVERRPIVKPVAGEKHEIIDRYRRAICKQIDLDVSTLRMEYRLIFLFRINAHCRGLTVSFRHSRFSLSDACCKMGLLYR